MWTSISMQKWLTIAALESGRVKMTTSTYTVLLRPSVLTLSRQAMAHPHLL